LHGLRELVDPSLLLEEDVENVVAKSAERNDLAVRGWQAG